MIWTQEDNGWLRSQQLSFADETVVQVDAVARGAGTGGWLLSSSTSAWFARPGLDPAVLAPPRSTSIPNTAPIEQATTTTLAVQQQQAIRIGIGVEAINEQVAVPPGTWEILGSSAIGSTVVRWPC